MGLSHVGQQFVLLDDAIQVDKVVALHYLHFFLHEIALLVEASVYIDLYQFQTGPVEEGMGLEDGMPASARGRTVLVPDEMVQLIIALDVVRLHSDPYLVGEVLVVVVISADCFPLVIE